MSGNGSRKGQAIFGDKVHICMRTDSSSYTTKPVINQLQSPLTYIICPQPVMHMGNESILILALLHI